PAPRARPALRPHTSQAAGPAPRSLVLHPPLRGAIGFPARRPVRPAGDLPLLLWGLLPAALSVPGLRAMGRLPSQQAELRSQFHLFPPPVRKPQAVGATPPPPVHRPLAG